MPDHESPSDSVAVCGKRRRTLAERDDAQESLPQPAVSRSSFWFDDGSVVIQAEHTQFRVHRTMLSRHSQIFRDMFSVPQPVDSEDTIEGCPIVHLTDSAQDVTHLLSALYDQVYTTRKALSFSVVAAMLRLGSKYDFHHLRQEALVRLRAEFPTTLEIWDTSPAGYTHILKHQGILYDIVNLALEQGLLSILPAAYYCCILLDMERIFKGIVRDNGSRAILLPEAQQACILGRQKILEQQANATLSWLTDDALGFCESAQQCARSRWALSISIFKPVAKPFRSLEPWEEVPKGSLCTECLNNAEEMHDEGRYTMWDNMPQNFGFPPWDELKELDR